MNFKYFFFIAIAIAMISIFGLTSYADSRHAEAETATFAAGCFWGVEHSFSLIDGVISTRVGYTGGTIKNPTYEEVCKGRTGHAEAVEVTYDPDKVSYKQLLDVFWKIHNPASLNRQGYDFGNQYRSAIFFHNKKQKKEAIESKRELENSKKISGHIVTEIKPASAFYPAEEYHQQYIEKNGIKPCRISY